MNTAEPFNQKKLFGINNHLLELIKLYKDNNYPNKLLLSGSKGIGKSTLAYHFINYVLSEDENYKYDIDKFEINPESPTYKTILNKSNANLIVIDINAEKKSIDISQIRSLINNLNKSSFNNKPRFVLIDNIELLNVNSANALLKTLEEPNQNIFFILINNEKKVLSTIKSRCLDFKISLTYDESISVINDILGKNVFDFVNKDLLNYYFSPGNIYNLIKYSQIENINLKDLTLKNFLKVVIKEKLYKGEETIKSLLYEFVELMLHKTTLINYHYYNYFLKRIDDMKRFNLDEESFFIEFESKVLNA